MVADPCVFPVTLPDPSTVAMFSSPLVHVRLLSVALLGDTVAVSWTVEPGAIVRSAWSSEIPVTATDDRPLGHPAISATAASTAKELVTDLVMRRLLG
jgi:hypothetical protein